MNAKKKLSDFFRAESGLRLFNSILDQNDAGMIIIDLDGRIMFASNQVNESLSVYKRGIRDQSIFKYVCPNDADVIEDMIPQLQDKTQEQTESRPIRLRHANGEYQHYNVHGIGIYSEHNTLECVEISLSFPPSAQDS